MAGAISGKRASSPGVTALGGLFLVAAILVAPAIHGSGLTTGQAAELGPRPAAQYANVWTTWSGNNNAVQTGTGCTLNTGSAPSLSMSSAGVVTGTGDENPTPTSSCSPMWYRGDAYAGGHACVTSGACATGDDYTPSSTRTVQIVANWTFTAKVSVWAWCGVSGNGGSQPNYAEVNVTPYMEVYDTSYSNGWDMPNTYFATFHLDSRDLPCTTSGSGSAAQTTVTFNEKFQAMSYASMLGGNTYEIHTALDVSMWQEATGSAATEASYAAVNTQIGTMNFVALN